MWRDPGHGQWSSRRSARASARDRDVWCIKETCVSVQAIIDNAKDGFALPVDVGAADFA
jgi:hypothetical protein